MWSRVHVEMAERRLGGDVKLQGFTGGTSSTSTSETPSLSPSVLSRSKFSVSDDD